MSTYHVVLQQMQDRYRELTGFGADDASDIGIRLKVLAEEIGGAIDRAEELRTQVFPQTSGGRYLELHAQTRGISRKPAVAAAGVLRFSRESGASGDIVVGEGLLCSTRSEDPVFYETSGSATLYPGELWVEVPARAVEPGEGGNCAPGAIRLMVSAAAGMTAVTNPAPFDGGVNAESDEELRHRLLLSYENISNSTNRSYYYNLVMQNEGVASAAILPRRRGRGTVDVVIAGHSAVSELRLAAQLQEQLAERKEINVDVQVFPVVRDSVDLSVEIALGSGYLFSQVSDQCRRELTALLDGMEVGKPLLLAAVGAALFAVEGVSNYRIRTPSADGGAREDHVVRCGQLQIWRMAE